MRAAQRYLIDNFDLINTGCKRKRRSIPQTPSILYLLLSISPPTFVRISLELPFFSVSVSWQGAYTCRRSWRKSHDTYTKQPFEDPPARGPCLMRQKVRHAPCMGTAYIWSHGSETPNVTVTASSTIPLLHHYSTPTLVQLITMPSKTTLLATPIFSFLSSTLAQNMHTNMFTYPMPGVAQNFTSGDTINVSWNTTFQHPFLQLYCGGIDHRKASPRPPF